MAGSCHLSDFCPVSGTHTERIEISKLSEKKGSPRSVRIFRFSGTDETDKQLIIFPAKEWKPVIIL